MNLIESPIVLVLVGAIPSFVLGILAYRRSVRADKVAEQSGIVSSQTAALKLVIEGLNNLADSLQEDNKILRLNVNDCAAKLQKALAERDALHKQLQEILSRG